MKSRVHPTYKTKYRVANWACHDRALIRRGDITVWLTLEAVAAWQPVSDGRRGGQLKYSDLATQTALTLRLVCGLPFRQTDLSRRSQRLDVELRRAGANEPVHLIVDSSGPSIVSEGEWAAAKHGRKGKRAWRKLHLGVDRAGIIVAQVLTDGNADDAAVVPDLLDQFEAELSGFVADGAYDSRSGYDAATARGAAVSFPHEATQPLAEQA